MSGAGVLLRIAAPPADGPLGATSEISPGLSCGSQGKGIGPFAPVCNTGNDGPVSTAKAFSFLNAASTIGE